MRPITEIWDEIRPQAAHAFWVAFQLAGYDSEHLSEPPTDEPDGKAWALAKIAAWRAADLKTEELFELHGVRRHPEILCDHNDRDGMECPF